MEPQERILEAREDVQDAKAELDLAEAIGGTDLRPFVEALRKAQERLEALEASGGQDLQ
jgi:hypothetical protein